MTDGALPEGDTDMTGYRSGAHEDRKRRAAQGQRDETHQRKSIAGGRWRSGPHKAADRKPAVRRIDNLGGGHLDETPDY